MKAIRFHEHGGPDVLRYEDAPDPSLVKGEALIRVHACALNHLDLWHRRGIPGVEAALPMIGGSDASGEIVESGASGLPVGMRVMLQPGISCGHCQACLSGLDNLCPEYAVLGTREAGACAEFVKVPAANLIPIPDHVDFNTAAAFPLTFLTAWQMLLTRARLQCGDDVLVIAGGSGVGQAAIQIAKIHGARVFATAGNDIKLTKNRELGADAAINHYDEDLPARIRELTDGRGVDIVVEHVGEATWDRSLRCLAKGGRLVTCGATTGYKSNVDLRFLFVRQLSLLGSYMGSKGELWKAAELFFSGRLNPVIDSCFLLEQAAEAHTRLESSNHFGKIVLTC